jgi:arylsulfatase A
MPTPSLTRRALLAQSAAALLPAAARRPPNFIVILADDQGYGDLACYGSRDLRTPNIDRLAADGVRFTSFYAAPVCTPSRAQIMTGCHPMRLGLGERVLFPYSTTGLNPDEITLPEILKTRGYTSAIVGKWHLGHHPKFLPRRHGFDYHFGTPYSNDMNGNQYKNPVFKAPPLPLLRNEELIEQNPDQNLLTRRYTSEAIQFLRRNRERPFFLYLAHNMPHLPLAASTDFRGKSRRSLYGDAIEELDWSTGEVLRTLQELGLERDTLVLYTSDNGPAREAGPDNGSAGPLRGRKASTWEGGMRVPGIARWPGRIPAGRVCDDIVSNMDLLPTLAKLAGAPPPSGRRIDGVDVWSSMSGSGKSGARSSILYYQNQRLQALRSGRWKLHVDRQDVTEELPLLYDLVADIGERNNLAKDHPDVVRRLMALVDEARRDLGDQATGATGAGVRPVGTL